MSGMKWIYLKEFEDEYNNIVTAFFNLFRELFDEKCAVPMLFPNYIALRFDSPLDTDGVRCFRLTEDNDFLFNCYLQVCCNEMAEATAASLPKNVKGAVIDFDIYDCARWILSGFLSFSVGVASIRMNNEWKKINEEYSTKIWEFVSNIDNRHVSLFGSLIETCIRNEFSLAIGVMDTDPRYVVPYIQ